METTAANVAQDKIFRGKLSFLGKQIDEKSRFGELFTEEIQEMDNAVPVATKKARQSSGWDYLTIDIS